MKEATKILKIITIISILLCILSFAQAKILTNVSTDKSSLYPDEIGALIINLFNDSQTDVKDVYLRIESAEGITFPENDGQRMISKQVDLVKGMSQTELKVRIQGESTKSKATNLFVYYGDTNEPKFASGTFISIKPSTVIVTSSTKKVTKDGEEYVNIDFKLTNNSKEEIKMVMAEVTIPDGFELKTSALITETLSDKNSISTTFEIRCPLNAAGEQNFILSYGYIDTNQGHYFEKNHKVSFVKNNNLMLGIIGIIVLAIAVIIYIKTTNKSGNVKGTGDKKK